MIFSTYYCERVEPFSACMNLHIYYILSLHGHFHIGLVIIPKPPYWSETMGRGMITRPIWKCPCIKLFITYFRHLEKRHPYRVIQFLTDIYIYIYIYININIISSFLAQMTKNDQMSYCHHLAVVLSTLFLFHI
jgi:hypothetical protein